MAMSDNRVIKTYVWHGGKCYFVSTIERDSSAILGPRRFNETMVWEYDWNSDERGQLVYEDGGPTGSIRTHQAVVEAIYENGIPSKER